MFIELLRNSTFVNARELYFTVKLSPAMEMKQCSAFISGFGGSLNTHNKKGNKMTILENIVLVLLLGIVSLILILDLVYTNIVEKNKIFKLLKLNEFSMFFIVVSPCIIAFIVLLLRITRRLFA